MIAYDFEVFKHDWLVVFTDVKSGTPFLIVNDVEKLQKFYDENKNDIFIGFNNKNYDNKIFSVILQGGNPYHASQLIIEHEDSSLLYDTYDMFKYPLCSIDLSQYVGFMSLKEIEGYLGMNIEETSVDFNIERPLTKKEIELTAKYCTHDVKSTIELLKNKFQDVMQKIILIKEFNLRQQDVGLFNGGLTAKILGATGSKQFNDEFLPYEPIKELDINKYTNILSFYTDSPIDYERKLNIDVEGVPHVFAWGGIHGAIPNFEYRGRMMLLDVTSYYPSMMIEYDFMSRQIPSKLKNRFKEIYETRVKHKAAGNKKLANVLKLVLNTKYGVLKMEFNKLYDPRMSNNVCITGQLLLLDLIEKVSPYCKLVQSNTDGILVIPHSMEDEKKVIAEKEKWEKRTRMGMDIEYATYIMQKDVNNYILEHDDGSIKCKGGEVSQYRGNNEPVDLKKNLAIIDKAIVEYFVHGVPVAETIRNEKDIHMFQIIKKTGRMYFDRTWLYKGEEIPLNMCNRWYASTDTNCGEPFQWKYREIKKTGELLKQRTKIVPNCPTYPMLDNEGVMTFDKLDYQYYIDLANEKIKQFRYGKKTKRASVK